MLYYHLVTGYVLMRKKTVSQNWVLPADETEDEKLVTYNSKKLDSNIFNIGTDSNKDQFNRVKTIPSGTARDVSRKWTQAAPVPCPISVTFVGSPPNTATFSLIQCSAAIWSIRP